MVTDTLDSGWQAVVHYLYVKLTQHQFVMTGLRTSRHMEPVSWAFLVAQHTVAVSLCVFDGNERDASVSCVVRGL